jgi:hypothetical protein
MDLDGDPTFHRSKIISVVQDMDQYYDKGDDFGDLNNDVNVSDLLISRHLSRPHVTSRP